MSKVLTFVISVPRPVLKLARYWLQILLSRLEAAGEWSISRGLLAISSVRHRDAGHGSAEPLCRSVEPWDTVERCCCMFGTWWIATCGSVLISYIVLSARYRRNIYVNRVLQVHQNAYSIFIICVCGSLFKILQVKCSIKLIRMNETNT
jgi:hypothetical protein